MNNLLLLAVCFLAGHLARKSGRLPAGTPQVINAFVLNLSLPALTIRVIHQMTVEGPLLVPMSMAWIQFLAAMLVIGTIGRWLRWSKQRSACLMLTAGLGNTSFVGLPMIEAFFGPSGVPIGVIADQTGSFIVLSTLGIMTASRVAGTSLSTVEVMRRILMFPSFIAFILAMILRPIEFTVPVEFVLERLGQTLAPLALFSVGYQLRVSHVIPYLQPLGIGLLFKLIFVPALIACIYLLCSVPNSLTFQVTVFEAAMPPMITGAILAAEYDLEPDLAVLMVGIGIPISFLSLWGWWTLMQLL